ncbi:TPA: thioredoxin-disulfide reductase [Candidatus Dependentiae bacterium]|nr:MAG: Thioredoxin reductase [candidate division TM6 bacterium GW2011_GWF2_43_87]HBL98437.1 thioredoxin-disulfide reductase [Candidatus Dependentiae bacterium]
MKIKILSMGLVLVLGALALEIAFSSQTAANSATASIKTHTDWDTIIIGGGPAGLAAGMHIADAHFKVTILTGPEPGGLLTHAKCVENWPGILAESGMSIMDRMLEQAKSHGADINYDSVTSVDFSHTPFVVTTKNSGTLYARTIIIATGSSPRQLKVPGEAEYWGHGVSSCALCDSFAYMGKDVAVIGGGDSAVNDAIHLADYAKKVTVFVRAREMRAKAVMQDKLNEYSNRITIIHNKQILAVLGTGQKVTGITIKDRASGAEEIFPVDGVFVAIGHEPNTWLFKDFLTLSPTGHILIDAATMQTSIPGIFAAGDVVEGAYKQVPVAVGNAIVAAGKAIGILRYGNNTVSATTPVVPLQNCSRNTVQNF